MSTVTNDWRKRGEKFLKSKIIAFSGVTAGGKTSLVKALQANIPNSITLHFDDYDIPNDPDYFEWMETGEDYYNLYDLRTLEQAINEYRNRYQLILLDYPFSYLNNQISPYIDYSVYIETPLDLAFARQLVRDYQNSSKEEILKWAQFYAEKARVMYVKSEQEVKPNTDFVLDGTLNVEDKMKILLKVLKKEEMI